jgi:hypothetical protein
MLFSYVRFAGSTKGLAFGQSNSISKSSPWETEISCFAVTNAESLTEIEIFSVEALPNADKKIRKKRTASKGPFLYM